MMIRHEHILRFLHQRNNEMVFSMAALLRTGFGLLFLAERYLLSKQFDVLFYPSTGLLPLETAHQHAELKNNDYIWTIFQLAPHSDRLVDILWTVAMVQAVLLLVGVFPRLQLVGLFAHLVCFHNHNAMVWESSDTLFRLFCFFLLFLPVHKHGLSDWILNKLQKKKNPKTTNTTSQEDTLQTSWPLWPYRLLQCLWTMIYFSTALSVWDNEHYRSGDMLFYIRNSDNWNPLFFSLDAFLANVSVARYATWTALALFSTCWWLVWIPTCRKAVVCAMAVFHLMLETLSNTHLGNSLLALGWLTFLVQPCATLRPATPTTQIGATALVLAIALLVAIDSFPLEVVTSFLPGRVQDAWEGLVAFQYDLYDYTEPLLCAAGLWQGIWDLSIVHEPHERISFQAILTFADDDKQMLWSSPDFKHMSWWEKRRHGRVINYFASLPTPHSGPAAVKLCDELRSNYGTDMAICELVHRLESDPFPPPATGVFAPTHAEMERFKRTVVKVHYCVDQRQDCEDLLQDDDYVCDSSETLKTCAHSCGECLPLVEFASSQYYSQYEEPEPVAQETAPYPGQDEVEYDEDDLYYYEDEEEEDYPLEQEAPLSDAASALASVKASSAEMLSELLDDDVFEEMDDFEESGYVVEDELDEFYEEEYDEEYEYDEEEYEYDDEDEEYDELYEDEYDYYDDDEYYDDYEYDYDYDDEDEEDEHDMDPAPSAAPVDQSQTAKNELEDKGRSTVAVDANKATGKEASLLVASGEKKQEEKEIEVSCEGPNCDNIIHMLLLSRGLNATNVQEKESVNY